MYQLQLPLYDVDLSEMTYRERLVTLLSQDLDFHSQDSRYASHNFHSFPAKFPPQLPRKFITALTDLGDVVLDPMMGSGTTILEALLTGRQGLGFDIDPLALMLTKVKITPLNTTALAKTGHNTHIGQAIGFDVPKIGVRHLDRNRRMMPAGSDPDPESQIQQRMHEEYVIGFYKPEA